MNCPNCKKETLQPRLTRQGVEIDYCDHCGGIWFDEGEIFHFTKRPAAIARELERGNAR